jgi:uncharacterized phiE125 gp8 family phage protein
MEHSIKIKQVILSNSKEIVSLEEVKSYLKVDFSEQDEFIENTIRAAREYAETFLSTHLVQKKFIQNNFGQNLQSIRIMQTPVIRIEYISIIDTGNKSIKLTPEEYYFNNFSTVSISKLSTLYNQVDLSYTVGYEDINLIPAPIKIGTMIHIASIYDRGDLGEAIPQSSLNLYQPYRKRHL